MSRIKNPALFSAYFEIDPARLKALGILDPFLNVDTGLFIDPLLLPYSAHPEMLSAAKNYKAHFEELIEILAESEKIGDQLWKAAQRKISYNEVKGICLGYGAETIAGSGMGPALQHQFLLTAKEIIELGVKNPKFIPLMMLFEKGIGPDRISDLTANVIFDDLLNFNERMLKELDLKPEPIKLSKVTIQALRNPFVEAPTPIILVPLDVLRHLPMAGDWGEIMEAIERNREIRDELNDYMAEIFQSKIREKKEEVRKRVLANREALEQFIKAAGQNPHAYDIELDPEGLVAWYHVRQTIAKDEPLNLVNPKARNLESLYDVVKRIIEQFTGLIENKGLWKELWVGDKARPEKAMQRLFFAVADSYCRANNLDITPEADSGNGPVDFKFSSGYDLRVVVEIKRSTNTKIIPGFEKQLEAYKEAEGASKAGYLVIDVGGPGDLQKNLLNMKNDRAADGLPVSDLYFVDGQKQKSASKR